MGMLSHHRADSLTAYVHRAQSCVEQKRDVQRHVHVMHGLMFLRNAGQLTIFFLTPV